MSAAKVSVELAEAVDNSAVPLLRFIVRVSYQPNLESVLHVAGELFTASDVFLSRLEEAGPESDQSLNAKSPLENNVRPAEYMATLTAQLSDAALKAIEKERESDQKRDVKLKLKLYVTELVSNAKISSIHLVKPSRSVGLNDIFGLVPPQYQNALMLPLYYYDPNIYSTQEDGWLISGNGGPNFLILRKSVIDIGHKIPASDWVNDFKPKMKLGKYLVVELPEPLDSTLGGECFDHLQRARKAFDMWNAKEVFVECREMATCLDKLFKEKAGAGSFLYDVRWGRAYQWFAKGKPNWSSWGIHEEDKEFEQYNDTIPPKRSDVEALLLTAEVLFKYATELLKELDS
ncbi:hypothetical protein [Conexivisphaera calida]|nr:hypothetical protein [Conexivisphaera calida]